MDSKKLSVDDFVCALDARIAAGVLASASSALRSYDGAPARVVAWALGCTQHAALTAVAVHWTSEVEGVLEAGAASALGALEETLLARMAAIAAGVRGGGGRRAGVVLGSMLTQLSHELEVVRSFGREDQAISLGSYAWLGQMRMCERGAPHARAFSAVVETLAARPCCFWCAAGQWQTSTHTHTHPRPLGICISSRAGTWTLTRRHSRTTRRR